MAGPEGAKIVAKSLRLLRAFAPETPTLSAVELGKRTGLSVSSVYRFLATFREHGLVEVDGNGRFRLGLGLLDLAAPLLNGLDIRRASLRALEEVQAATKTTAFLTVLREDQAVCVEKVESDSPIRICPEIGKARPLHAGAPAKVLLAFMEPARREAILSRPLARLTGKTVVDRAALRRQLAQIRSRGYAITDGEFLLAARAAAVPIRDREGRVVASFGIAATTQVSAGEMLGFVPLLRARAEEISAALGYRERDDGCGKARRRLVHTRRG